MCFFGDHLIADTKGQNKHTASIRISREGIEGREVPNHQFDLRVLR